MENFQEIISQAAELKEVQLKRDRKMYESLPSFLKNGLAYAAKYQETRRQHLNYQLFVSDLLKMQGNALVKQENYQQALLKYEESLGLFRWIDSNTNQNIKDENLTYRLYECCNQDEQQCLNQHLYKIYLNISLCLAKTNKKSDAVSAAQEGIKLEPMNPKGHYRKACAYLYYINRTDDDAKRGFESMEKCYELSGDRAVKDEMVKLKREIIEENKKCKKAFSFMINGDKKEKGKEEEVREEKQVKKEVVSIEEKREVRQESLKNTTDNVQTSGVNAPKTQPQEKTAVTSIKPTTSPTLIQQKATTSSTTTKPTEIEPATAQSTKQTTSTQNPSKQQKTQARLLKLASDPHWQTLLLQNFITKYAPKISAIMQMFHYSQYKPQHDQLLRHCLFLKNKLNQQSIQLQQNGQKVKINLKQQQARQAVFTQKSKVYSQYMNWLHQHPMTQIIPYLNRHESHRQFILNHIEKRDYVVRKAKPGERKNPNNRMFYLVIAIIACWILVNAYRNYMA